MWVVLYTIYRSHEPSRIARQPWFSSLPAWSSGCLSARCWLFLACPSESYRNRVVMFIRGSYRILNRRMQLWLSIESRVERTEFPYRSSKACLIVPCLASSYPFYQALWSKSADCSNVRKSSSFGHEVSGRSTVDVELLELLFHPINSLLFDNQLRLWLKGIVANQNRD